ncbi:putative lipid II flippase FtsW [Saccharibacillus alkalitolerans]|uniref:Probable peptidoglycan glycosyltransferase FtsW n=1 Tax=Saccharibacillus alkalitolerans TaxID=2705290 RepID=A0ABX0F0B8_9BACL|nr:putative lipid II flippase FtsW [Saccharibacillus alkalitolerans]NGZ73985.1 putative lipid II flippase FtsW [Saccharibacillus alkalitolerans]
MSTMRTNRTNQTGGNGVKTKAGTPKAPPDFQLLILTLILTGFGLLMVFSASSSFTLLGSKFKNDPLYFALPQLQYAVLGVIVMLIAMSIPYKRYKKLFIPMFFFTFIMLIVVLFMKPVNGAHSWISLGPVSFQPTELAKISTILYLAALISKKGERFRDLRSGFMPVIVIVGVIAGLVMLQPDFGSCMILVSACLLVIYAGGASLKHILGSILIVGVVLGLFFGAKELLTPKTPDEAIASSSYKADRIQAYLNPFADPKGSTQNLLNSLIAIGEGGATGAGYGQSVQKLSYLSNPHNDFIFAIIGEEFGFIGTAAFLLLYLYFLWRGLLISLRCPDIFGTLTGVGIVGLIGIQAFVNIGGVSNTIPLTGVTLPFISHGGTSLLITLFSMGILLSISRDSKKAAPSVKGQTTETVTVPERRPALYRSR